MLLSFQHISGVGSLMPMWQFSFLIFTLANASILGRIRSSFSFIHMPRACCVFSCIYANLRSIPSKAMGVAAVGFIKATTAVSQAPTLFIMWPMLSDTLLYMRKDPVRSVYHVAYAFGYTFVYA
jgi:hypothetical protein